jgi:hypothetical protein
MESIDASGLQFKMLGAIFFSIFQFTSELVSIQQPTAAATD